MLAADGGALVGVGVVRVWAADQANILTGPKFILGNFLRDPRTCMIASALVVGHHQQERKSLAIKSGSARMIGLQITARTSGSC